MKKKKNDYFLVHIISYSKLISLDLIYNYIHYIHYIIFNVLFFNLNYFKNE